MKTFYRDLKYRALEFNSYVKLVKNWPILIFDYFGLVKNDYLIRMKNGLKFKLKGGTFQRFPLMEVFNDHYFLGETNVKEGDVVVDLGANAGLFSVYVAQKAQKIYAVEPILINYRILLENIKLNGYEDKVIPLKLAITDSEEIVTFNLIDDAPTISLVIKAIRKSIGQEKVRATTLSNFILENNIEKVNFLKMDIEGSEYIIILKTDKSVFERIDKIAMELHTVEGYSKGEIIEKLQLVGYKINCKRMGEEEMLYAKRI